ncbi:MAG: phosphoribosyl-AMP cyclohydrolase [Methanomicrobiales archaeon]
MKNNKVNLNFRHEINGEKLLIAISQDYETSEVLMVAYMNEKAFEHTLNTGKVHYWSTSREKIWLKGESSGHIQHLKEIFVDCDQDAVLLKVVQDGGACHEGYKTCFFRKLNDNNLEIIKEKVFEPDKVYGEN